MKTTLCATITFTLAIGLGGCLKPPPGALPGAAPGSAASIGGGGGRARGRRGVRRRARGGGTVGAVTPGAPIGGTGLKECGQPG